MKKVIKLILIVVATISLQSCKETETLKSYDKVSNVILEKYSNKDFDTLVVVQDTNGMIFLNKEGKLDKGFSFRIEEIIPVLILGMLLGALVVTIIFFIILKDQTYQLLTK